MSKPLNVDPAIVNNGLTLKEVRRIPVEGDSNWPMKLLAFNGKIIPGQVAIDYGNPGFWGVRNVTVTFQVYTGDGESQKLQEEWEKEV